MNLPTTHNHQHHCRLTPYSVVDTYHQVQDATSAHAGNLPRYGLYLYSLPFRPDLLRSGISRYIFHEKKKSNYGEQKPN